MPVRVEVVPFLWASLGAGVLLAALCRAARARWARAGAAGAAVAVLAAGYMLFFFRNPPRTPPADPEAVLAAADGRIAAIVNLEADAFRALAVRAGLKPEDLPGLDGQAVTRISIFLSLFDVHVNRAPIGGKARFLGYVPGRHYFTFEEKSSDHNQHNSILFRNDRTTCLLNQIVGPVCRRVVYWLPHTGDADVAAGDPIGMMKFGSRLDVYFPAADIAVAARVGDRVRAGETVVARLAR